MKLNSDHKEVAFGLLLILAIIVVGVGLIAGVSAWAAYSERLTIRARGAEIEACVKAGGRPLDCKAALE